MKEIDIENEVKTELLKTIRAKNNLLSDKTVSFRYNDPTILGPERV